MSNPNAALVPFTFRGDSLEVARLADGDVGLPLRRLCEVLGLSYEGQAQRLARTATLADGSPGPRWATTCVMHGVGADGKAREMTILPRRSIPMWAATVDASRVAPEVREKLVAYQDEAAEVLAAAFLGAEAKPAAIDPARRSTLVHLAQAMGNAADQGDAAAVHAVYKAMGKLAPRATPAKAASVADGPRQPRRFYAWSGPGPVPPDHPEVLEHTKPRVLAAVQAANEKGHGLYLGAARFAARMAGNRAAAAAQALLNEGVLEERGTSKRKHGRALWVAKPAGEALQ